MSATEKWNTVKLQDIAEFKTGKLNSYAAVVNGKYPFFTCSRETFKTNTWSFDCECVLLAGNNANAEYPVKYFKGKFDAYQRTYVITTKDPNVLNIRFLYYGIELKLNLLKSLSTGAATRFITKGIIDNLEFNLPDINEQNRIVNALAAYDNLIENNNRRIAILEEMAQSLYREWFVKFRFPGHENNIFIDSPLGKIPEGWEVVNLNEVADNFDRLRKPLSKMQRADRQGIYPYYGAAKVFDYIDDYIFDGLYLLLAEDGSVITPERKPVLQLVNEKFWPNNHTHILRAKNGVNTEFLNVALSQVDVSPFVTGAAQPKINQTNMNRIQIIKADDFTQAKANEFYKDLFAQYFVLVKKNKNLRKQRDLLLPKLISGAIEIKNTDEVAA